MRTRLRALGALIVVALWAPAAAADPPPSQRDPVAAEALFRRGRESLQSGDVAGACELFAESLRLDPAAGTLLNLATCEERLGRLAAAWEHYRRALDLLPAADPRISVARERVAALEPRLPRLTVSAPVALPAGASVLRDGVSLGLPSLGVAIPVDPGDHTIVVRMAGRRDAVVEVELTEGELRSVEVAPGEATGTPDGPAAGASPPPPIRPSSPSRPLRPLGVVALGVGAAAIATGAITGVLALGRASVIQDQSHCDDELRCDQEGVDAAGEGSTLATVSTIGFVVGGVAAVAGVVMLLLPGGRESSGQGALRVRPELASFAGLVTEGTF